MALRRVSLGLALGVLATAVIAALTHPELANGVVALENRIQHQSGIQIAIAGIYLEESGVGNIEVRRLAPAVESMPALASLPEEFREAFFGSLDYAITGRKL